MHSCRTQTVSPNWERDTQNKCMQQYECLKETNHKWNRYQSNQIGDVLIKNPNRFLYILMGLVSFGLILFVWIRINNTNEQKKTKQTTMTKCIYRLMENGIEFGRAMCDRGAFETRYRMLFECVICVCVSMLTYILIGFALHSSEKLAKFVGTHCFNLLIGITPIHGSHDIVSRCIH